MWRKGKKSTVLPKIKGRVEKDEEKDSEAYIKQLDMEHLEHLDDWADDTLAQSHRTHSQAPSSLVFLYKARTSRMPLTKRNTQSKVFYNHIEQWLAHLPQELARIRSINYYSIYCNVQYCKGVYENSFNGLLRKVQHSEKEVHELIEKKNSQIHEIHDQHIKSINYKEIDHDGFTMNQHRMEREEKELEILQKMLQKISLAREKILKFALQLGYDIRDEGLVWILKQLKMVPEIEEFPLYLTEKEIQFIIEKYKNTKKISSIHEEKDQVNQQEKELIKSIRREIQTQKRKLSLIREKEIFEKLINESKHRKLQGHKYLTKDTLKIVENNSRNIKATKYEIIYQETLRKLNRLCTDNIYSWGKKNDENRTKAENYSNSKLVKEIKTLVWENQKLKEQEQSIHKTEEDRLAQIINDLKKQQYHQAINFRNPITILGCLVGWKKAQKILENTFSIPMISC